MLAPLIDQAIQLPKLFDCLQILFDRELMVDYSNTQTILNQLKIHGLPD
jgi:hypothetical protein